MSKREGERVTEKTWNENKLVRNSKWDKYFG